MLCRKPTSAIAKSRFHPRKASGGNECRAVAVRCLPSSAEAKVVCLGEALFGHYERQGCGDDADMLANDKGKSKEDVTSWTGYPGGAPCNVACGLGKLGVPVAFVSSLGNDDKGTELLELMRSAFMLRHQRVIVGRGVDTSSVCQVDHPTRDVYVVRTMDGDRIFDSFGQDTNTYCDCFISPASLPKGLIEDAEVLVMGTLGLAYSDTGKAMKEAMVLAREAGTLVMIDCNWRPVFWDEPEHALDVIRPFMEQADLVKITDEEAEWAYGIPTKEALENPASVLRKLPQARAVLVTAGGAGAAFCIRATGESEHSGFVSVYDVSVQDTTGAGDAFTCGFLAYLLSQGAAKPIRGLLGDVDETTRAVKFAAACGALTTLAGGAIAAQPELQDVQKLVLTHE